MAGGRFQISLFSYESSVYKRRFSPTGAERSSRVQGTLEEKFNPPHPPWGRERGGIRTGLETKVTGNKLNPTSDWELTEHKGRGEVITLWPKQTGLDRPPGGGITYRPTHTLCRKMLRIRCADSFNFATTAHGLVRFVLRNVKAMGQSN